MAANKHRHFNLTGTDKYFDNQPGLTGDMSVIPSTHNLRIPIWFEISHAISRNRLKWIHKIKSMR